MTLEDTNGIHFGAYRVASRDNVNYGGGITPSNISHSYRAGLPVPAGSTLEMTTNIGCGGFSYSVLDYTYNRNLGVGHCPLALSAAAMPCASA